MGYILTKCLQDRIEAVRANLAMINDDFLPTSRLFSAMRYLEPKLLRFQGLIWRINHFCILLSCGDIAENIKN